MKEKPKRADYYFDVDFFIHDLEEYEASRREVEVNDVSKIGNQWILEPGYPFEPYPLKHNQPCEANVKNGIATITKIL